MKCCLPALFACRWQLSLLYLTVAAQSGDAVSLVCVKRRTARAVVSGAAWNCVKARSFAAVLWVCVRARCCVLRTAWLHGPVSCTHGPLHGRLEAFMHLLIDACPAGGQPHALVCPHAVHLLAPNPHLLRAAGAALWPSWQGSSPARWPGGLPLLLPQRYLHLPQVCRVPPWRRQTAQAGGALTAGGVPLRSAPVAG